MGLNGRFSFQLNQQNRLGQVGPDASEGVVAGPGFPSPSVRHAGNLVGCEIRAQLPGYMSTSIHVTKEPTPGPNELGTIVVYYRDKVLEHLVSVADLMAPQAAQKDVEHAKKAVQKKNLPEAEGFLKSAVEVYPQYAEAWFDLGLIYEKQQRLDEAASAYRQAVKADKMYVRAYMQLMQIDYEQRNWREAADISEKLITVDPVTLVEAYFVSAHTHFQLGELALSEKRAAEGLRIDASNRFPQFYLILADISVVKQDLEGSVRELQSYLNSAPNASNADLVRSYLQKLQQQGAPGNNSRIASGN